MPEISRNAPHSRGLVDVGEGEREREREREREGGGRERERQTIVSTKNFSGFPKSVTVITTRRL